MQGAICKTMTLSANPSTTSNGAGSLVGLSRLRYPASSTELITFPRARVSCRSGGRRNTVGQAPLTIPNETIRLAEIASYICDSVQETGIDGLARTNLRFS